MKKTIIFIISLSLLPFLMGATYNYSFYGNVINSSPGMTFAESFDGSSLGITLRSPEHFAVFEDKIYAVDSGINTLLIIDDNFELVHALKEFPLAEGVSQEDLELKEGSFVVIDEDEEGDEVEDKERIALTLQRPEGIDVKSLRLKGETEAKTYIFVADTYNNRIIKLNDSYEVLEVFSTPDDLVFETTTFHPRKVTVDVTGRMYVVARNIFEGIVELSKEGDFNRYVGVNPIKLSALEIFRRALMTQAQLEKLRRFLPTSYTSVMITEDSFMYATARPRDNNAENTIQLINPKGLDVINRNGYFPPMGDIHYLEGLHEVVDTGPSELVDITYTDGGIYSVLDQKRSRVFTYDREGNLLFIDGSAGAQRDKFRQGVALNYFKGDLIVLDRFNQTFIVYRLSEFGELVTTAVQLEDDGKFNEAAVYWEEILTKNSNYEIAYNGIGKAQLREGNYKDALENFKLGHDTYYYSKAYKEYRNAILRDNFSYIMAGVGVLIVFLIGRTIYKKRKKGESLLYED